MFNLQSGAHRQSFPGKGHKKKGSVPSALLKDENPGHTKAVTGLMVDSLNQTVISCGLDGKVKVKEDDP